MTRITSNLHVALLLCALIGCAKSHYREIDFVEVVQDPSSSETEGAAGSYGLAKDALVDGDGEASLNGGTDDDGFSSAPVLFGVSPPESCTNKNLWLDISGAFIHWNATVAIRYPFDDSVVAIDRDVVDECGRPVLEWIDLDQIVFRTHPVLGNFVSGHYLIEVENPDGSVSNAVGLNLQWCGEEVEETPSCETWSE